MKRFINKVVLVTGATSGIGRSTALAFSKEGAKVVIAGRREKEGNEVVKTIHHFGGKAIFIKTDVCLEKDVENMVDTTIDLYGHLDCAYNNAGVSTANLLVNETEENYCTVMNTNVKGIFLCMKHEIKQMIKSKKGVIINTSSAVSQQFPIPTHGIYNASKYAVIGLTETAAIEAAAFGIRINAICPIGISGRMINKYLQETNKQIEDIVPPIGRIGTPEDVSDMVLFLCSDKAAYITGAKFIIDGGMLLSS